MLLAEEAKEKGFNNLGDYTKHIRFARVTKVYDSFTTSAEAEKYGYVDLMWEDTQDQVNGAVSFLKPGYSDIHGYGIIVMPSVGDIAACYTVQDAPPIVLGFFSINQIANVKASRANNEYHAYIRPLKSGEILIKGKSQSEIHLQDDGRINITVKDGTNTTSVVNKKTKYTSEQFFDKASAKEENTVLDLELGRTGYLAGPANQVFSLTAGKYGLQHFTIQAVPGQLQYTIKPVTQVELVRVESVKLYVKDKDGKEILKKSLGPNSGIGLIKSSYYTQGLNIANDPAQSAATMDTNGTIAAVTIPSSVAGLLTSSTYLAVDLVVKQRGGFSFKVNELGDAIIDCRNFIVRSNEQKSYLGLFEDSRAVLGAAETNIGDKLCGYLQTDRGGVHLSAGINENAKLENVEAKNVSSTLGPKYYFYITDTFPLISYTPDNKATPFAVVSATEYANISTYDKSRITSRPFDPDFWNGGFTRERMIALVQEYETQGKACIPYGELRSL